MVPASQTKSAVFCFFFLFVPDIKCIHLSTGKSISLKGTCVFSLALQPKNWNLEFLENGILWSFILTFYRHIEQEEIKHNGKCLLTHMLTPSFFRLPLHKQGTKRTTFPALAFSGFSLSLLLAELVYKISFVEDYCNKRLLWLKHI